MNRKNAQFTSAIASLLVIAGCDGDDAAMRIVGQLESDRVELTAEVAEPIVERPVIEGASVTEGDLILQQDTARVEARIAEARAALLEARARLDELIRGPRKELIVAARANVEGAERELEFREAELDRAQQVFDRKLSSAERVDRARSARDGALASLEALQAKLEELLTGTTIEELSQAEQAVQQAEAKITALEIDLQRHATIAPVDAVVDSFLFEVGERPAVGQPMAILLSGRQPYARVYVPESLRVRIAPGMAARVFVDGLETPVDGRVRWVASEAVFTPYFALTERDRGRLSYVAKVDLLGRDTRLPDGVPVEVEFPGLGGDAP